MEAAASKPALGYSADKVRMSVQCSMLASSARGFPQQLAGTDYVLFAMESFCHATYKNEPRRSQPH